MLIHNNNIKKNNFLFKKMPHPFPTERNWQKKSHLKLLHFIMFDTIFSQEKEEMMTLKILKNKPTYIAQLRYFAQATVFP